MKKLIVFLFVVFAIYCIVVNSDVRSGMVKEANELRNNTGGGNEEENKQPDITKYTDEEIRYFNEIVLSTEFSSEKNSNPSKWKSDMNIFVINEKPEELMSELNKIVGELNDIIDPININIVDNRSDANFIICFGSQSEYNDLDPSTVGYTEGNWGLFSVNSGSTIKEGTMYVDIYRCESLNGQKHLLREELTQSLGLFNDSYRYSKSIFQQDWTETTEYEPIDIKLIEMLYNQ